MKTVNSDKIIACMRRARRDLEQASQLAALDLKLSGHYMNDKALMTLANKVDSLGAEIIRKTEPPFSLSDT